MSGVGASDESYHFDLLTVNGDLAGLALLLRSAFREGVIAQATINERLRQTMSVSALSASSNLNGVCAGHDMHESIYIACALCVLPDRGNNSSGDLRIDGEDLGEGGKKGAFARGRTGICRAKSRACEATVITAKLQKPPV